MTAAQRGMGVNLPVVMSDVANVRACRTGEKAYRFYEELNVITVLPSGAVEFRFFRRDVEKVCIAGTFNGWRDGATPMQELGGGWWRAELTLGEGLHQFRYLADGEWFTDFAAHGVEHSKWGMNSLVLLGRARAAA